MKKMLYVCICLIALSSLPGCFWHSETVRTVPAESTTTVVSPPNSTVTTTP